MCVVGRVMRGRRVTIGAVARLVEVGLDASVPLRLSCGRQAR